MNEAPPDRPLAGVRVVDGVRGPMASATRYLAELGARVDKIVNCGDDPVAAATTDLGKYLSAADPHDPLARDALANAHIVIEDVGLDVAPLLTHRPALVVVSVSPFGRGNSLSDWQASDAVLHALSGELSRSGIRGRAPLLPPGRLAWECAATQAAFVALQSFYHALRTGRGQHIDFAALDGAVQALDPGFGIGGSATQGRPAHLLGRDRPPRGFQYPILPCADGHVRLCLLASRQWQGMFRWMGEPAAFADPSFNKLGVRYKSPQLLPAIAAFFADRTRAELEHEAATYGVPLSGLTPLHDTPSVPHFVARGTFASRRIDGREVALPAGSMVVDGRRMTPDHAPDAPTPTFGSCGAERPFSDLRVLDLGIIVVGAEAGRMFADQGADVVKVESRAFPDGNRQSYLPYGLSVSFAAGHRNKRGLGLDLRHPDGRALFLRLVEEADVVLSNFKPGTMDSLGIGHDVLTAANPRIVSVESSAFGPTGPWSRRMGYGPLVRAAAGVTEAWRYPDDAEGYSDSITIYPDHVAGRISAMAAIALLVRRERTGKGGAATISQAEVLLAHFARELAGGAEENSQIHRCAGDDEWCVVTIRDAADVARINDVTDGLPLAEWLARCDADDAMRRLQAALVPAARMLRVADLPGWDYYRERELFRAERHPHLAEEVIAEARQALGPLPNPPAKPAPLMGEHSDEVIATWIGDTSLSTAPVQHVDPAELVAIAQALHA